MYNKFQKIIATGVAILGAAAANAADPTTAAGVVDAVTAIPTAATETYIGGAVLGLGILTVGIVVYVLRKGVKMR